MTDRLLIATLCLAEIAGMIGISVFPALLPEMQATWGLDNTQARSEEHTSELQSH